MRRVLDVLQHRRVLAGVLLVVLARPAPSTGAPLEESTLSNAVFTGPTHPHASSIFLNPAALGLVVPGWHIYLGASARVDQYSIDRNLIDASGQVSPGPSVSSTMTTPGGIVAAYKRWEKIAIGMATFTPMAERFISGKEDLRYHTLGGHHYQISPFMLSVGWRPIGRFVAGFGLSVGNLNSLRLEFDRDTALDTGSAGVNADCAGSPCGIENPRTAQRYRVEVGSKGLRPVDVPELLLSVFRPENIALTFGFMYEMRRDWWLGMSYQGSPGLLGSSRRLDGTVTVTDSQLDGAFERTGEAVVEYNLPDMINLGVRGPLPGAPDYDLVVGARFQAYARHNDFDIRMFGGDLEAGGVPEWSPRYRGFQHTYRFQAGIESREHKRLRYGARVGVETAAVSAQNVAPTHIAGLNLGTSVGVEYRVLTKLVLGAGYGLFWFPSVDATDSAYSALDMIACVDSNYELDACQAAREGRAIGTASGTYGRLQHAFTVSMRWELFR